MVHECTNKCLISVFYVGRACIYGTSSTCLRFTSLASFDLVMLWFLRPWIRLSGIMHRNASVGHVAAFMHVIPLGVGRVVPFINTIYA